MKTNKKKAVFWFVVFLILCTPLFMFLTWYFSPFKHMEILIVDKTVITEKRDEHSALNWVLNYEKYAKINDILYDKNTDYYGFFPKKNEKYLINDFENFSEKNIDSIVDKNDVFFIAMLMVFIPMNGINKNSEMKGRQKYMVVRL